MHLQKGEGIFKVGNLQMRRVNLQQPAISSFKTMVIEAAAIILQSSLDVVARCVYTTSILQGAGDAIPPTIPALPLMMKEKT